MPDTLGDSSENEFPDVDVVVKQYRPKAKGGQEEGGRNTNGSASRKGRDVKATPLRRRKLGQTQITDESLLRPWGKIATSKEEKSRTPNPRGSLTRIQVKEESTEPESSSKDVPESMPARARRQDHRTVSSGTDTKLTSKKAEKLQRNNGIKSSNAKTRPVPKNSTRIPISLDESSEESDMSDDIQEFSEEEVSEFVSASDSETDTWNSGSEHSETPPIRRSRSPTIRWAKPQRALFKDPDKAARSNKQPQATISNPTNYPPKQHGAFKTSKAPQPGSLENAFQKLQIFNEDSGSDEPPVKGSKNPILEPTTPRKTFKAIPASPLKTPRIPISPWKPEQKEFWDSEVHFGWIDKHSPEKKLESPKKAKSTAQELKMEAQRKYGVSPEKKDARKAFDAVKESLARTFLQELDDRITDGKLTELTEDTGGLKVVWSNTLRTTAGRAYWKCKTLSTTTKNADGVTTSRRETRQHIASIELSTHVLTKEFDLMNTVAHEFCHLAVFLLYGKVKNAHGAEFKAFGERCGRAFADRGIVVTTKHNYEIEYKYIWECQACHNLIKRHSRSVKVESQSCGRCRGALKQVKPIPRGGGGTSTPTNGTSAGDGPGTAKKKPTPWNEFLSVEMKALSQSNPGMAFKDKMATVSAKWNKIQQQQKQEKEQQEEKRKQTIKELEAAVEILNIDDNDDDEQEDEEIND
ncbi:SprT-like family-domain-containing protein [Annulohypoxylon moriforme]|nr:SprT-like family-domain-containing protein [Annulohypoxylon moriforme]